MRKSISNIAKALNKAEQKLINGGGIPLPHSEIVFCSTGCFATNQTECAIKCY